MCVDEIVAHILGKPIDQAHPDDVTFWREIVADVIRLHESPRRWVDEVKPTSESAQNEAPSQEPSKPL